MGALRVSFLLSSCLKLTYKYFYCNSSITFLEAHNMPVARRYALNFTTAMREVLGAGRGVQAGEVETPAMAAEARRELEER